MWNLQCFQSFQLPYSFEGSYYCGASMNSWVSALLVLEKTLLQSYRSLSNFAPRQIFSLNILDKLYLSSRKVWSFASTFNPRCLTCYISQDTSWDPTYFYCYCSNQEKHKNFARINYGRHGILIFSCLLFDLFEKICSIKSWLERQNLMVF